MNKTELVTAMAEKTGTSKENCDKALNAFIDIVKDTLAEKEKVNIIGFGSFEARFRAARKGMNPLTKEEVKIAESYAPMFKAGKDFKERVNK